MFKRKKTDLTLPSAETLYSRQHALSVELQSVRGSIASMQAQLTEVKLSQDARVLSVPAEVYALENEILKVNEMYDQLNVRVEQMSSEAGSFQCCGRACE